ncbi:MAG: alpha/beta fold hydrolase [Betaproteobacteria bacterium]|nr:alpha/beta fold hydrolase [Betaproteobacteria bacterium]
MNYADLFFQSDDGLTLYARDYAGPSAEAPVVLCLHGLTRNSKDFWRLAEHMQARARVVVPDTRGRGRSARDPNPANYRMDRYARDMIGLLDHLGIDRAHLIGTSMGGLISMLILHSAPRRVTSLVINDIGPEIDPVGLARIASYAGKNMAAPDWRTAAAQVRASNEVAFLDYTESDWHAMACDLFVQHGNRVVLDYDPAIAHGLADGTVAPDLWPVFAALERRPMLVVRGEVSDILSRATVERMRAEWPGLHVVSVENRGHTPTLMELAARSAIDELHRLGG